MIRASELRVLDLTGSRRFEMDFEYAQTPVKYPPPFASKRGWEFEREADVGG